jgi:hypothetical protein
VNGAWGDLLKEDTLGEFLRECCTLNEQASIAASQLYAAYKDWTLENGLKSMNSRTFGVEMRKRVGWGHARFGTIPPLERPPYEAALAAAHLQLGEDLFTASWENGFSMTAGEVLAGQSHTH